MNATPVGRLDLFLGPDRARKLQRIQHLAQSLSIQSLDHHHVDASTSTSAQLLALCRQQPAVSSVRLIVVDQAHRLDAACLEALLAHTPVIVRTAYVVLLVEVELSVRHALARVMSRFTTEQFSARAPSSVKPFALTDALSARDLASALEAVHSQRLAGQEALEILGLVAWQVQRWVAVKRLVNDGSSADGIASTLGLRTCQVERVQAELTDRSLGSLQELLDRCWRLDVDVKSGKAIPWLAVEHLVMEVCRADQANEALA